MKIILSHRPFKTIYYWFDYFVISIDFYYPKTQPNRSDSFLIVFIDFNHQAPFVKKLDNAIHWINLYPVDSFISMLS